MRLISIRKNSLQMLGMFSIAVLVLNFLSLRYLANEEIRDVDMSVLTGHIIVIDPGHGGIDSGASGNNVIEKEVTLEISIKLAAVLESHGGKVILTRERDIDYYTRGRGGKRQDLLTRIEIMEKSGAEIFMSVHCNAFRAVNLSGAQVFYSPKFTQNKVLADRLQQTLREFPPGNKRQAKEDSHILILNDINIPGVLIEAGYVTNQKEASLLSDNIYQQKLVEQIARGLAYHFSQNAAR